ncbi:MAG: hypothetical protein AAFN77_00275 [Planctomycetota bacterium]
MQPSFRLVTSLTPPFGLPINQVSRLAILIATIACSACSIHSLVAQSQSDLAREHSILEHNEPSTESAPDKETVPQNYQADAAIVTTSSNLVSPSSAPIENSRPTTAQEEDVTEKTLTSWRPKVDDPQQPSFAPQPPANLFDVGQEQSPMQDQTVQPMPPQPMADQDVVTSDTSRRRTDELTPLRPIDSIVQRQPDPRQLMGNQETESLKNEPPRRPRDTGNSLLEFASQPPSIPTTSVQSNLSSTETRAQSFPSQASANRPSSFIDPNVQSASFNQVPDPNQSRTGFAGDLGRATTQQNGFPSGNRPIAPATNPPMQSRQSFNQPTTGGMVTDEAMAKRRERQLLKQSLRPAVSLVARYDINKHEVIPGTPVSLFEMLSQPISFQQRSELIHQYWETYYDWAALNVAQEHARWSATLPTALSPAERKLVEAEQKLAQDRLLAAQIQMGKSQSRLLDYFANARADDFLPIPSDVPTVMPYDTYYETIKRTRSLPSSLRGIDQMLEGTNRLIVQRADTVTTAQQARTELLAAVGARQSTLASVIQAAELCRAAELDLVSSVTNYNQAIGHYMVTISPSMPAESLVTSLLGKTWKTHLNETRQRTAQSISAWQKGAQPFNQPLTSQFPNSRFAGNADNGNSQFNGSSQFNNAAGNNGLTQFNNSQFNNSQLNNSQLNNSQLNGSQSASPPVRTARMEEMLPTRQELQFGAGQRATQSQPLPGSGARPMGQRNPAMAPPTQRQPMQRQSIPGSGAMDSGGLGNFPENNSQRGSNRFPSGGSTQLR